MRTSHLRGVTRLALSLTVAASTLAGFAVLPTASAQAASVSSHRHWLASAAAGLTVPAVATTCTDESTPPATVECPTITSVTVGSAWIRSSKTTPITIPVTVVLNDPADIVLDVETLMGRGLEKMTATTDPDLIVGTGFSMSPPSINGTIKTFELTVVSYYEPDFSVGATTPAYGGFQITTGVFGASSPDPIAQDWKSGSIKAVSAITNTPSATAVHKGQSFTERGKLTRFDGTPQIGQKVTIFMVPAGQTRGSYAGTATTAWNGTWSLPVRSWFTGSWFVSYPGSVFSTSVYKGVWVRVS